MTVDPVGRSPGGQRRSPEGRTGIAPHGPRGWGWVRAENGIERRAAGRRETLGLAPSGRFTGVKKLLDIFAYKMTRHQFYHNLSLNNYMLLSKMVDMQLCIE
jgi:hypothetical protein